MENGTGHGPNCLSFRDSDGRGRCIFMSCTRKGAHLNLSVGEVRTHTFFLVPQTDQSSVTLEFKTKVSLKSIRATHTIATT